MLSRLFLRGGPLGAAALALVLAACGGGAANLASNHQAAGPNVAVPGTSGSQSAAGSQSGANPANPSTANPANPSTANPANPSTSSPATPANPSNPGSNPPSTGGTQVGLQPNAQNMKVAFLSPPDQIKIDAAVLPIQIGMTGFTPRCDLVGTGVAEGQGHYDLYYDNTLVNLFCSPTVQLSMQQVAVGKHTLTAVPAQNDNVEVRQNAVSISFQFEPTSPVSDIGPAKFGSAPSIRILSPAPDSTVSGVIDVVVGLTGFNPNCDLMGKGNVTGYGNWFLTLDNNTAPSASSSNGNGLPGNLLGFSCTRTFRFSTAGLVKGSIHTLYAQLAQDDHSPTNPAAVDSIQMRIT